MKKYITTLLTFLLVGAGIAHAQCVSYSLSYLSLIHISEPTRPY